MNTVHISPLPTSITADVEIPGSLSYTIRALTIAAMIEGSITIKNPAKCDDTDTMVTILKTLGVRVEKGVNHITVHGSIKNITQKEYHLNVHLSGRTARIILGFLCIVPGIKTVICDAGFKKRPVKDLVDALRQLGAEIEYLEDEGYLPVKITSEKLMRNNVSVNGTISSQYISSLLLIGPMIGGIEIKVPGEQASKPFIDMTIGIMKTFGVDIKNNNYQSYKIENNQTYKKIDDYIVEADAIAASYFFAIAALTKSTIKIVHLSPDSYQGDVAFADVLARMGCEVVKNKKEQWIAVKGTNNLTAISLDMNHTPDTVPTLAVVSAFAKGKTKITGLLHLKIKESDRLTAPKNELQKMGITGETTEDSLTIIGGQPKSAAIETYGDHRIAMAFAIAGTKIPDGITIKNPDVVNKSFPNFWEKLEEIGVKIQRI
jgi:3-phosphoshikimate 1-carboxyvinyltransferase